MPVPWLHMKQWVPGPRGRRGLAVLDLAKRISAVSEAVCLPAHEQVQLLHVPSTPGSPFPADSPSLRLTGPPRRKYCPTRLGPPAGLLTTDATGKREAMANFNCVRTVTPRP